MRAERVPVAARHEVGPQEARHRLPVEGDPLADEGRPQSARLLVRGGGVGLDEAVILAAGIEHGVRDQRTRSSHTTVPPTMVATGHPLRIHPPKGVFRPLLSKREGSTFRLRARSRSVRSAGEPGASVPPGAVENPCRVRGEERDEPGQVQEPLPDQSVQAQRHRRLEPDDAVGSAVVLDPLVVDVVGCMIGGNAVDGPVLQPDDRGEAVGLRPERGLHLGRRVVRALTNLLVGQAQVVGRHPLR